MTCASCAVPFLPTEEYVAGPDKNPYHAECLALAGQKPTGPVRLLAVPPAPVPKADPLTPQRPPTGPDRPIPGPEPYDKTFPVVLDERRRVIVPLDFNEDDLEYVFGCLDLYCKKRAKAAKP